MYDHLKDENVTIEVLEIIKCDHLKELLNKFKLGDRVVLELHFENWRNEIDKPLDFHSSSHRSCHNCSSTFSSINSKSPICYTTDSTSQESQEVRLITLAVILNSDAY
ncbi:uncharacterized protein LOC118748607 isoform X2 [Rhagoletis pomonella]|uniref:uncharacterized protein LOC118748607 isoform X2 n=1 Tax=Rhagoletis pomonella TaxID=28610 RepID=UPI001781112E|nr:uncharacterized protein LOC118748607 isoform X2 [Rhagoletis pomonella]